jgi:hypothetical protein
MPNERKVIEGKWGNNKFVFIQFLCFHCFALPRDVTRCISLVKHEHISMFASEKERNVCEYRRISGKNLDFGARERSAAAASALVGKRTVIYPQLFLLSRSLTSKQINFQHPKRKRRNKTNKAEKCNAKKVLSFN